MNEQERIETAGDKVLDAIIFIIACVVLVFFIVEKFQS